MLEKLPVPVERQAGEWKELDGFEPEEVQERDQRELLPNDPEMPLSDD